MTSRPHLTRCATPWVSSLARVTSHRSVYEYAIDLGARGRYAAAWFALTGPVGHLDLDSPQSRDSRSLSIRASHLRQIGMADLAQHLDARAIETAQTADEAADAGLGWAADALAQGHVDEARDRFAQCLDTAPAESTGAQNARIAVRIQWVGAEIDLAAGHQALAAERLTDAVAQARLVSQRHLAKSLMFLAAVRAMQGNPAAAHRDLIEADAIIDRERWISLWWPWTLIADGLDHDLWGPDAAGIWQGLHIDRARAAVGIIRAHLPEDLVGRWAGGRDVQRLDDLAGRYPWQT